MFSQWVQNKDTSGNGCRDREDENESVASSKNERITKGSKVEEKRRKGRGGREEMRNVGERPGRSSDIYPINRFESSNRGSGDRSDTYTHTHTYAPFRVPPRGRLCGYQRKLHYVYIYLMPNVDLLCLITGADIDGSVCASRSAVPRRQGGREGKREGGEGGIGSGCLFAKSPLSPCGSGRRRSDGGVRALSNEMASNIVVVVRGICVGRIGRGW